MINRRKFLQFLGLSPLIAALPKMFALPAPKSPVNIYDKTGKIGWFVKAEKGYDYVIGVDQGGLSDPSAISIWRKGTDDEPLVQVAEYSCVDPNLFAVCEKFGEIYSQYLPDGPLFSIEQLRSPGDLLQHRLKLAGFRRHHKAKSYLPDVKPKEGWYSNAWSRPMMIEGILFAYREKRITVKSKLLVRDIVVARMDGKKLILPDENDDHRFMAAAIAVNSSFQCGRRTG